MLTTGTQNLQEPLARAQAACRDRTVRLAPASADRLGWRVEHFASSVREIAVGSAGRALVTTLLDPARVREPDVSVPFELWVMGRLTVSFARWADRAAAAPTLPDGGRSP